MNVGDRRYTDRDVREDPRLVQMVQDFLREYAGDFEFLIKAKGYYTAGFDMPTATIRGVLNCMRYDPAWAMLLPEPRNVPPTHLPVTQSLRAVDVRRPAFVVLRTTFKKPYVMSTFTTAQVVHLLDNAKSELRWLPHVEEYRCWLLGICGTAVRTDLARMMDAEEVPTERRLCKGCQQRLYERNA
jgi:hypothetical protein